jgi:hypothetical protein
VSLLVEAMVLSVAGGVMGNEAARMVARVMHWPTTSPAAPPP